MRSGSFDTLLTSQTYDLHGRVRVLRTNNSVVDLSNRCVQLSLDLPNASQPIGAVSVELIRETADPALSIAPTVTSSTLNTLSGGYNALLQIGRTLIVEVALTAEGAARPSDMSAWDEVFRGPITDLDWGRYKGRKLTVQAADQARILQLAKSETAYSYDQGATVEATVSSILSNNGFSSVSTSFAATTGSVLATDYEPGLQKTVWSQLWSILTAFGWVINYRYTGTSTLNLVVFQPARTKTTPDLTISNWWDFEKLSISESEIRNIGYVQYVDGSGDAQLLGPNENSASIAKYGGYRRPFWIVLGEESPIRSATEGQLLLAAALSDLSDPDAIGTVRHPPNPYIEVGTDLIRWTQKGRIFSDDQDYAPFASRMEITPGESFSVSQVRGRPTAGFDTWRAVGVGTDGPVAVDLPPTIISAEVIVNQDDGAATLEASVDTENVAAVRYASTVGDESTEDFPTLDVTKASTDLVTMFGEGGTFSVDLPAATVDYGQAIRFTLLAYDDAAAAGDPGPPTAAQGVRLSVLPTVTYAEVTINKATGAVALEAYIDEESTNSVRYAYTVGDEDTGAFPTLDVTKVSTNLVTSFGDGGIFTATLAAGTVNYGQAIRFVFIGYTSADGTGEPGPPSGAQATRSLSLLAITFAEVVINRTDGGVRLDGIAPVGLVNSVAYAYNVAAYDVDDTFPTVAETIAREPRTTKVVGWPPRSALRTGRSA